MPVIWICFDAHREDGNVWAVREGRKWHYGPRIDCQIPVTTVYRGPTASQPRAYLRGHGRVTRVGESLRILSDD